MQVTTVCGEHGASQELDKEAKLWATKIAKENRAIRVNSKKLELLEEQLSSGKKVNEQSKISGFLEGILYGIFFFEDNQRKSNVNNLKIDHYQ